MANLLEKSNHTQETTGKLATRNRISITCLSPPYELVKSRKRLLLHGLAWITHCTKEPTTECGARIEPRRELAQETKRPLTQPSLAKSSHFLRTGCFITQVCRASSK